MHWLNVSRFCQLQFRQRLSSNRWRNLKESRKSSNRSFDKSKTRANKQIRQFPLDDLNAFRKHLIVCLRDEENPETKAKIIEKVVQRIDVTPEGRKIYACLLQSCVNSESLNSNTLAGVPSLMIPKPMTSSAVQRIPSLSLTRMAPTF